MDLLDRYLHAVRFWLPRAQQNDIIAELSEDIRSQIDEQEAKLGRKLNESELEAILKQRGAPLLVANRYRTQQYLIGPALFPVYRFVLIIVALCCAVPWTLTWISLVISDPFYRFHFGAGAVRVWGHFLDTIIFTLGVVTLVFAIIERVRPRFLENWNPRKLPPVRDPNRIGRINSLVDLAANGIFIAWWVTDMWSTTILNRGGVRVVFAPIWKDFLWAFLLIAIANIILAAVNLARPYWTWLRASVQLVLTIAASVAFCWMCKANIVAQIAAPNLAPARAAQFVTAINTTASKACPFALAACALVIALFGIGRLVRLRAGRRRVIEGVAA
jgi:hypothetical protein